MYQLFYFWLVILLVFTQYEPCFNRMPGEWFNFELGKSEVHSQEMNNYRAPCFLRKGWK